MKFPHLPVTSAQDTTRNFEQLGAVLPTLVTTTLPSPATDGQVVDFQNAAMAETGVVWRLRYRAASASTHRWEFIGGASLAKGPEGSSTLTAKEEKVLASGPTLTIPLTGEYVIALQLRAALEEAALVGTVGRLRRNGGALGGVPLFTFTASTNFASVRTTADGVYSVTAGDVMTVGVEVEQAVKVTFSNGRLTLLPIRVG